EGMGGHKKPDRRYFVGGWGGGRERPRGRAANKHNEPPPFHIAAPGCKATPCGSEHSRSGRCNRARSRELPPADCQPDVRFGPKRTFHCPHSITSSAWVSKEAGIVMSSCGGYLAHIFRRRRSLAP